MTWSGPVARTRRAARIRRLTAVASADSRLDGDRGRRADSLAMSAGSSPNQLNDLALLQIDEYPFR